MAVEENMCPKCSSPYAYPDGPLWICPECSHEWVPDQTPDAPSEDAPRFLDANGTSLQDGDTVITVKDLKAGKDTIKSGTKVKKIRLLDAKNGTDLFSHYKLTNSQALIASGFLFSKTGHEGRSRASHMGGSLGGFFGALYLFQRNRVH